MSPPPNDYTQRGMGAGLILLVVMVIVTGIAWLLLHQRELDSCLGSIQASLPVYPGAEQVNVEEETVSAMPLRRVRTVYTYEVADDQDTVRAWYSENVQIQETINLGRLGQSVSGDWAGELSLVALNGGTQITLAVECP
ncbi:MAG: hypothetical protein ACOCXZ_01395 [Chloroflexota bacterium]